MGRSYTVSTLHTLFCQLPFYWHSGWMGKLHKQLPKKEICRADLSSLGFFPFPYIQHKVEMFMNVKCPSVLMYYIQQYEVCFESKIAVSKMTLRKPRSNEIGPGSLRNVFVLMY